jgi:CheY-like chemotaxis protein
MMPEMGGIEATEIIRKTVESEKQPTIVALTADAFKENREQCLSAGMDFVLTKPINQVELSSVLSQIEAKQIEPLRNVASS